MANHKNGTNYNCNNCGAVFYLIRCRVEKSKNHFCSRKCKGLFTSRNRIKIYPKVIGTCFYCKGDIIAKNAGYVKSYRKYCSHSCATAYRNKITPKTQGQIDYARRLGFKQKGITRSVVTRQRMSIGQSGKRHWNWQGGKTPETVKERNSFKVKFWRQNIFKRDNYTCQSCFVRGSYLEAHHIKSWSQYPELRYELTNGVTLCRTCHEKTDNYGGKSIKNK